MGGVKSGGKRGGDGNVSGLTLFAVKKSVVGIIFHTREMFCMNRSPFQRFRASLSIFTLMF